MEKKTAVSIDEYLAGYTGEKRTRMDGLRALILSCSPDITEKIAWGMPTFVLGGNLVHFSAGLRHIGLHPSPEIMAVFAGRLAGYKYSKGTLQLPDDKPLPWDLVREMVRARIDMVTGR